MDSLKLASKASLGVLYFGIYSFCGWILEVGYRFIMQHHFVNPGLLQGPFLPIYGLFCLLVIAAERPLVNKSWGWHFAFFIAATTLLEYSTGWYFLHQFNLRLWDYCDIPFNYHGFVALPFSLAWGILGLVFKGLIHPFIKGELSSIPLNLRLKLASLIGIYLLGDIFYSLILLTSICSFSAEFL
ncbi:MAG TPA: putative ABC transporter permease [Candidatus Deferrimicrobium sp.]|nr:putative ABC transporter permease [Candidatus Deferrimicrobium sp.]